MLRVFAAVLVLIIHSTLYISDRLAPGFALWTPGAWGVDVFFVISGFVMVCSYTRLFDAPDGWRVFASHRVQRIVPMYWLATTVKLGILLLTTGVVVHVQRAHLSWSTVLSSYLFIPARTTPDKIAPLLSVGWSLNFEMFFYFLFALALFMRVNVFKFVGFVLSLTALASIFVTPSWPAASFYLDAMGLEFFFGMLIAKVRLSGSTLRPGYALPLMIAGVGLLLWPRHNWEPRILQVGIPAAMIVAGAVFLEPYFGGIPKWLLFLADASYVTYLFHPVIAPAVPLAFARAHIVQPWIAVPSTVFFALVVTSLIYKFIDAPVSKYLRKKKLVQRRGELTVKDLDSTQIKIE